MQNSSILSKIAWWIVVAIVGTSLSIQGQAMPHAAVHHQPSEQWLNFEHLTSAQGLSNERVQAIVQDQLGFLWIGTRNGVFRYDGGALKSYQHNAQKPGSLPENTVFALHVDRRGILWVGTQTQGLWRFDHATEEFRPAPGSASPNITTAIRTIFEDSRGRVWVGSSGQGIYRLDPDSGAWENYNHEPGSRHSLSNNYIHAIIEDRAGVLWVGTRNGLNKFNPQSGLWTPYIAQFANAATSPSTIISIAEDNQGMLWLAAYGDGLYRFDPQTAQTTRFARSADPNSLSDNKVSSLYYDRHGELWAGTWSGGLNRFDPETGGFTRYQNEPLESSSLGHGAIMNMYEDRAGSLWLCVDGWGLAVYHRSRTPFHHYTDNPLLPEHLSDAAVRPIYQTRDGIVWIGTAAGGLNRLDPATGHITHYLHDPADPHSLSGNSVYAIAEDRAGALWVGTYHGLNRFERATQQFTRFLHDPNDPASLSYNFVRVIAEEADGHLWIGTDHGLNRFNPITGRFQRYLHDPDRPDSLSDESVFALMFDREHTLWVGTLSGGLNRFEPETGGWIHYRHNPADPASLSHDTVYTLYEDRAGQIWVGTASGLNRLERATGRFVRYTELDGLPSETITGILEEGVVPDGANASDENGGHLWLSTLNGLVRFNPRTAAMKVFDRFDGLLNQEYDFFTACRTRYGEMWFGGKKGIDIVDPSRIIENTSVPPVVLTDFEINNQPVPIGADSVLQRAINFTDALTLSYRDRVITFEFAALNFIAPMKNRYQYRLEGFDTDWVSVDGRRRRATYTNLNPGQYVFRVRGSNNDDVWNETGVSLPLTITPPWWRARWFYALCAIGGGSVFGLVYWNKTAKLRRERVLSLALRKSELQLSNAMNMAKLGHWELDVSNRLFMFSESFYAIFHTTSQEMGGYTMTIDEYANQFVSSEDRHLVAQETQKAIETDDPHFSRYLEHRILYADGGIGHIAVKFFIIKNDEGATIKIYGVNQDISERKKAEEALRTLNAELEQRVAERTAQLTAMNEELASFAYIVSHDLKAPLRNVSQLATWLVEDYAEAFDDTGREYTDLLIQRVKRMGNLIDGVLEYSRVGRVNTKTESIELNDLLPEVVDMLAPPSHVTITLPDALPIVFGDRVRITQVFQNLLDNAVKFLDKPCGEIGVSCSDVGGMWQFCITDNGPGIDPKYHETIFQIFRTNRPRDQVENTGVGLTIVKKIVEFCGGTIGVESEVGQGSAFVFTLPKAPTEAPE